MDLDLSEKGNAKVSMIKYICGVLEEFPEEITGSVPTPYTDIIFTVRNEKYATYLSEDRAMHFYRTTAHLIFLLQRARRDIQPAVDFLTTRAKKPDADDWGKLRRFLRYLNGTLNMELTLAVDNMSIVNWFVGSPYMTHMDCKVHVGGAITLGKGAVISISAKIKSNTKSSTETEIYGENHVLNTALWRNYLLEAQGYKIKHNIIHQDNQSCMRLQINGSLSSSGRTNHIKARYYYITDKIEDGDIEVKYCPTD